MRHHVDAGRLDTQLLGDLRSGEARDGNDGVAVRGCLPGLFGEARTEFGRGVVAGHHKQIVEGRDGPARAGVHPLVEGVEQIDARSGAPQPAAAGVGRQRIGKRF